MNSTVTLYRLPEIPRNENFVVDDMYYYLQEHANDIFYEAKDFQYQRMEMTKEIKINFGQNLELTEDVNFVVIRNNVGAGVFSRDMYFFVDSYRQVAQNTVMLRLTLDVLNTFFNSFRNFFDDGTVLTRAHFDRFFPIVDNDVATLVPIFDKYPEGDNPNLRCYDGTTYIKQNNDVPNEDSLNFYLIYRTDGGNGKPCMDLACSREIKYELGTSGGPSVTYTPNELVTGRYYYVLGHVEFRVEGDTVGTPSTHQTVYFNGDGLLVFWKGSNDIVEFAFISDNPTTGGAANRGIGSSARGYLNIGIAGSPINLHMDNQITIDVAKTVYFSTTLTADSNVIKSFSYTTINAGLQNDKYIPTIENLDRTDSRIVKIIETPYCPINYTYSQANQLFIFADSVFETVSPEGFLRTYNLVQQLPTVNLRPIIANDFIFIPQINVNEIGILNADLGEPKIYTSEYFRITTVYDSFSNQINLEDFDFDSQTFLFGLRFNVTFKQSSNISSSCIFEVKPQGAIGFNRTQQESNYPSLLVAKRNNELPLYTSEYLNYLRNGYNYDKKKLQEQTSNQLSLAAIQTLASVISFALSGATGGVSAAAGIGLAAGATTSFASLGMQAKEANEALSQKINLLKAQSFNVQYIDDLDLFKTYSKNKLQLKIYQVSENDFDLYSEKFKLYGYARMMHANPRLYMDSRHFYNYIKCDPVFNSRVDISDEYLESITNKCREGFTIFHANSYIDYGIRLTRNLENWENSLMELKPE